MSTDGSLTLVLPAYNEAENVVPVLEAAVAGLDRLALAMTEVILVDDGSTDRTAELALEVARRWPDRVRVVQHSRNLGYGAAIRTGWLHARGQFLAYSDADRQFDLQELARLIAPLERADVVIGFRVYRYDTVLRSLTSYGYNRLVSLLFRVRVRDVDCAYKVMRREVFEQIALEATDFFIDTEILARSRRWGFRIEQVGVRHYPRVAGDTTVHPSDVVKTLKTVARMWRRIHLPSRVQLAEGRRSDDLLRAHARELGARSAADV